MSTPQRLTIVAAEFPYPVTHGGRADMWRRIQGLAKLDVRVQLVCWYSQHWGGPPAAEHIAAVESVVDELIVLPIPLGPAALLRRLVALARWPSHVGSRAPTPSQWRMVLPLVEHFRPAGIWQDGLWGAVLAQRLAAALKVPRWVRSHNIEHQYFARQAALARGLSERLRVGLNKVGLRRFEFECLSSADAVFDISLDDLAWWRSQGLDNLHWLPPLVEVPEGGGRPDARRPCGAMFVGNLHTPNNVEAVLWFLRKVWPRVRAARADAVATIAGAKPHPDVVRAVQDAVGARLVRDPPDVWLLYRQAAVLINPAVAGSGVAIKTVEMLHTGVPVISTSIGVQGLPPDVARLCHVADDETQLADLVIEGLDLALEDRSADGASALSCFTPMQTHRLCAYLFSEQFQRDALSDDLHFPHA